MKLPPTYSRRPGRSRSRPMRTKRLRRRPRRRSVCGRSRHPFFWVSLLRSRHAIDRASIMRRTIRGDAKLQSPRDDSRARRENFVSRRPASPVVRRRENPERRDGLARLRWRANGRLIRMQASSSAIGLVEDRAPGLGADGDVHRVAGVERPHRDPRPRGAGAGWRSRSAGRTDSTRPR